MQFDERASTALKLLFPLLILALLGISPVSNVVSSSLLAASVARESGRHQAAAAALRQAAEREPWRTDLWEQIGREEWAAGRIEEAEQALQASAARGALSADGRFLLGEVFWQQGKLDSAETQWQALLDGAWKSTRVYERLAQLHRSRGDFARAAEVLRGWRSDFPQDAKAAFLLGLHLSAMEPDAAIPALLDASRLNSDYTSAVQVLRGGLALAGNTDDPAYAWLLIGRSLASLGHWDLAQAAFEKSITAAPDYAEAWAFLGEARAHLGGSGKPELEKARALDDESVLVKALSAVALRREGDFSNALAYLLEIEKHEPQEPNWQVEIGSTMAVLGDLAGAHAYFARAVELAPDNSHYWQSLAWFSITYHYDVRGIGLPASRRAVQLAPDDAAALDVMGWTMAVLGDRASAERFLQRALDQDAVYAPACLHLGQVYLEQGNAQEARFYLKIASDQDVSGPVGDKARRLLRQYFRE